MICKINKGTSVSGLIDYITNEMKDGRIIASKGVCTIDRQTIVDSFAIQCAKGTGRTRYTVGHFALSWHPDERKRMTPDMMAGLAVEFMQEIGYGDTQYIVRIHTDTDHPHCHVAYNRIGNDGKALNDSYLKKRAIKACRLLEKRHGLRWDSGSDLSEVNAGRLRGRDRVKFGMKKTVLEIARGSRSWRELQNGLEKAGISMSFRYGKEGGIKGVIFSDGEHSFGGKSLHSELSLASLDGRFGGELAGRNFGADVPEEALGPVVLPYYYSQKDTFDSSAKKRVPYPFRSPTDTDPVGNRQSQSSVISDIFGSAEDAAGDIIVAGERLMGFLFAPLMTVDESALHTSGGGGSSDNELPRKKKDDDGLVHNRNVNQSGVNRPAYRRRR